MEWLLSTLLLECITSLLKTFLIKSIEHIEQHDKQIYHSFLSKYKVDKPEYQGVCIYYSQSIYFCVMKVCGVEIGN